MAKGKGGKGGFGKSGGGGAPMSGKLISSPMSAGMTPKGGGKSMKKGY